MSIENNNNVKARSADNKAVAILEQFFDGGVFTEVNAQYGEASLAEAVCGYGYVDGMAVCAFCQDITEADGAMSTAQAKKLTYIYELALKIGAPVVGFYNSKGARLAEGNMLLDALGGLLSLSSKLSGVVPQVSVVLGNCVGTTALLASNADFVIKTEDAVISLDANAKPCNCGAICEKDEASAIDAAKALVTYLPSNNLALTPSALDVEVNFATDFMSSFDANTTLELYKGGEASAVYFARLEGNVVGVVETKGKVLEKTDVKNITKFVKFCDAFSIPVVTAVDAEGFKCLGGAKKVLSAYSEATTPKVAVITGKAVGAVYLAMVGNADATLALDGAVVSPIKAEAFAYVMLGDKMCVPIKDQNEIIAEYASTELSALTAAKNGYINDVVAAENLRARLVSALDILSSKRETALPKKHTTV
ncbi:MAG: carboxyl transferase domain-containing protein [Ruminococcus sp.]|nr:carboxyl transferase domain-containing protein [Ruminococcus sp.]